MRGSILFLVCLGCAGGKDSGGARTGAVTDAAWMSFVATDNGLQRVLRVDPDGAVVWSVEVPAQPRELTLVGSDEVLVSVGNGAVRLSLDDGSVTWSLDTYSAVQSATPTAGGVLLAAQEGQDVVIYEVDEGGVEGSRTVLGQYEDLRLLRMTAANTALFTTTSGGFRIVEVGLDGTEIQSIPLPGKGYVADPTDAGTYLATTGGDSRLVELDGAGTVVKEWGGKEAHPDIGLDWASGYHLFADGSAVFSNWLGHGKWGTAPHLFWFDASNERVLWSWEDHDEALQITNLVVLDASADR